MRASSRAVPEGGERGTTTQSSPSSSSSSVLARLVLLLVVLLLFVAAAMLPAPTRPSVMTDFFASRELRRGVQCGYSESTAKGGEKENGGSSSISVAAACARAHSSAAGAASLSDFFGNSLALLVAPAFGRASDITVIGGGGTRRSLRSTYLSLALLSSALPPLTLALHQSSSLLLLLPSSPVPPPPPSPLFYFYFLFSALATAAPSAAICLAYAADSLPAGARAPAFAAVSAAVSAGLLLGAGVGAFLSAKSAAWIATAGVVVSAALAAWLPEAKAAQGGGGVKALKSNSSCSSPSPSPSPSLPPHPSLSSSSSSANPLSAFRLLTSTPQARRLLACVVLSSAAAAGLSDTIAQFLQQRLSFGAGDQALLLAVAGGGGLVAQAGVLPLLLRSKFVAGEAGLLRFGLAAALLEHATLFFASSRSLALAAVGFGSLGGLALPAASALVSDAGHLGSQGAVQGALSAARSGAAAVGPLAFAAIYYVSSRAPKALPSSFAGAPFAFGAALLLAALILSRKVVGPGSAAAAAAAASAAAGVAAAEAAATGENEEDEEAAPLMLRAA